MDERRQTNAGAFVERTQRNTAATKVLLFRGVEMDIGIAIL